MDFATDEEIKYAHDILIPDKPDFDDEKQRIIKSDKSELVQACPGSGKTTTLLAKLIILANRMPSKDGKGVCVLTHTNVAIDEIKAKLGQKADVLFSYPNFFGTFQTFVHKFITSKALHHFYNSSIDCVDDDIARWHLLKEFHKLNQYKSKLHIFLYNRVLSEENKLSHERVSQLGPEDKLLKCGIIEKKSRTYHMLLSHWKKDKMRSAFTSEQIKCIYEEKQKVQVKINVSKDAKLKSMSLDFVNDKFILEGQRFKIDSESGKDFLLLKKNLWENGILTFDDAYQLAFKYIREVDTDLKKIAMSRFSYVFIDEIQDCNENQYKLLTLLFDEKKITIQRFGDYCQAIFNMDETGRDPVELQGSTLKINHSNRFGNSIAEVLKTVCIVDNNDIKGNSRVPSVKPTMIVYNDPLDVLPRFVELLQSISIPEMGDKSIAQIAIEERMRDPLRRINIKACGSRAVSKDGANTICLKTYFPSFQVEVRNNKIDKNSLSSYLVFEKEMRPKDCAVSIINGICKILDLCNINNDGKRFSRTSLFNLHNS